MSTQGDTIYWVESIDGEAMGDFGGFTFGSMEEARGFIDASYRDELRLLKEGYYEERTELQILQVVTMRVESMPLVVQIPWADVLEETE